MQEEAFEEAVMMYKDRAHAYAAMMLRDPSEAQDVAQEALFRLWQFRERVSPEAARLWLMRTVRNLCIDRIRKRKVRAEVNEGDDVVAIEPDASPGPERLTASGRLGEMIERALSELSAQDRSVVIMREVQGLSYDEIAAILELPLGTLKARLHRARERLRQRLIQAGVDGAAGATGMAGATR
jgi:RNA polymerase sigma factor (sigma-70 family)